MLVSSKELVDRAYQQKWAIGAFNAVNLETAQAIFRAADETDSPFILQVTSTTLDYTEPETLVALITSLSNTYRHIPWALHLDHGRTLETVVQFIRLGFTSVCQCAKLCKKLWPKRCFFSVVLEKHDFQTVQRGNSCLRRVQSYAPASSYSAL